ncbi:MAG: hypothetical protein Q8Q09_03540 [Deltaproteobacteria bacterium]|nr:hypothetical protein [Deltaproteobacteria bacterium]
MDDADDVREQLLEGLDEISITNSCGTLWGLGDDACVVLAASLLAQGFFARSSA